MRLRGPAAVLAVGGPLALVGLVVIAPLAQLGVWSVESISDGLLAPEFATAAQQPSARRDERAARAGRALLLAYGVRREPLADRRVAARTATIGYGLPGSVVAVAVIVPLGWLERRIDGFAGTGLLLTGTVIGLFYAYVVRFLALAWGAVEASLMRIPRQLDEAARGLGADRLDVLARVHVPLLRTGLATAALLVFVEVMKELPATLLLRPLGGDTLAIAVWQATTESLFRDGRAAGAPDRARRAAAGGADDPSLRSPRRRAGRPRRPRAPGPRSSRRCRHERGARARDLEVVRQGRAPCAR